jgi:hypothetical protein
MNQSFLFETTSGNGSLMSIVITRWQTPLIETRLLLSAPVLITSALSHRVVSTPFSDFMGVDMGAGKSGIGQKTL